MAGKKFRWELKNELLSVWSTLTKAAEDHKTIGEIVIGAKNTSEAWKIWTSMVADEDREKAKEHAKTNFEESIMNNAESTKEYIARAKSLAINVRYCRMEVSEEVISRRVLSGPPPHMLPRNVVSR